MDCEHDWGIGDPMSLEVCRNCLAERRNPFARNSATQGAILDASRTYRYRLDRHIHDYGNGGTMLVVMLNPSTADEAHDDPTIRRVRDFAMRHACQNLVVCNLYAYRATNPAELRNAGDPIGPDNEAHLRRAAREADIIVAAWGASHLGGTWPLRVRELLAEYGIVHAFRFTKRGDPSHPLYIRADTRLREWHPLEALP